MRNLAWQIRYHTCCLLASLPHSGKPGGVSRARMRDMHSHEDLQWLLVAGRFADLQSCAAAASDAAASLVHINDSAGCEGFDVEDAVEAMAEATEKLNDCVDTHSAATAAAPGTLQSPHQFLNFWYLHL